MVRLPDGNMFIRFDRIHEHDTRTDRHCTAAKAALM